MYAFRTAAVLLLAILTASLVLPLSSAAEDVHSYRCLGLQGADQVIVYYFHRKFACQSCTVLEAALPEALERYYGPLLKDGRLAMCVVNLDDPTNRHYLEQFGLLSNSVVIVQKKAGQVRRFKNLEAIWEVSEDPNAISHLLLQEVASFLPET